MSQKEAERYRIMKSVAEREISLKKAAELMEISYRQASRLKRDFNAEGVTALISKKRGKRGNRALSEKLIQTIIDIIREHYHEYGPTLLAEKLQEKHNITVSNETVRKLLKKYGIPYKTKKRRNRAHQRRDRRDCEGELEQTDASIHHWFEDRGPKCALHLSIDDATGKIKGARFGEQETTENYWRMFWDYFQRYGLPRELYVDSRGVFRVNHKGAKENITQFKRSMNELGIKIIFASSPQAKGRVERVNGTLQDRLVKELREQNISSIEEANAFLPTFVEKHNKKFAKPAANPFNAHLALDQELDLNRILCNKHDRAVSKNLEVHFENEVYQIEKSKRTINLGRVKVQVLKTLDGQILIEYKKKLIPYKKWSEMPCKERKIPVEEIAKKWERSSKKGWNPPKNHPWKRGSKKYPELHKKSVSKEVAVAPSNEGTR